MGYWAWTSWFTVASLAAILVGGLMARVFVFEVDDDDTRHHGPKPALAKRPENRAQFFQQGRDD